MIHGVQNNAMAEIALALAMGFFSIMVLTLVSMGGGLAPASETIHQHQGVSVSRTDNPDAAHGTNEASGSISPDTLVIDHAGKFLDAALNPVDPTGLADKERIVLGVDETLSMAEAIKAREQIPNGNITVAPLDPRWQTALKEMIK